MGHAELAEEEERLLALLVDLFQQLLILDDDELPGLVVARRGREAPGLDDPLDQLRGHLLLLVEPIAPAPVDHPLGLCQLVLVLLEPLAARPAKGRGAIRGERGQVIHSILGCSLSTMPSICPFGCPSTNTVTISKGWAIPSFCLSLRLWTIVLVMRST